jgi:RNA polymerase sigma-70 factor (ECF subfamily)
LAICLSAISTRSTAISRGAWALISAATWPRRPSRAFAARKRYDALRGDERPWLFGIANNLLRRHYRDEERRLRAFAQLDVRRDDVWPNEPRLADALAALSREERDVLLLFAWADLAYDEIAVALGVPVGTVRSRLHRARAQFRAALEKEEALDG